MYKPLILATLLISIPFGIINLQANYSVSDSEVHGLDVDSGRVVLPNTQKGPQYYMCSYKGQPYYCTKEQGGQPVQNNSSQQQKPTSGTWDPNHDFSKDRY